LTFFSRPSGRDGDDVADDVAADVAAEISRALNTDGGGDGALPPLRALSRYSNRSPPPLAAFATFAFSTSTSVALVATSPPSVQVSSGDWTIFVASLNITPNVPSERTYPSPYLDV
jgi:hypothetical protein